MPRCSGSAWSATTPSEFKQVINDQLIRADLILTTGGVSQGDYDIVKAVMPELGRPTSPRSPCSPASRRASG